MMKSLLIGRLAAPPRHRQRAPPTSPRAPRNPDKEPQNWLMNHRDFSAQRFSPLAEITKSNAYMRLLFAIALGGSSGNEALEGTPLVEDGLCTSPTTGASSTRSTRDGKSGRIVGKMTRARESSTATAASL
jgi:alcohol dehydrogenase (cytochrome c)